MVPTAPNGLNDYAPDSRRRHIGRPLGSLRRAAGVVDVGGVVGGSVTSGRLWVAWVEIERVKGEPRRVVARVVDFA